MQYIISGRDIKITEVAESETTQKRKAAAKARPRDGEGRFIAKGDRQGKAKAKPTQKWMRLFVLAKPMTTRG